MAKIKDKGSRPRSQARKKRKSSRSIALKQQLKNFRKTVAALKKIGVAFTRAKPKTIRPRKEYLEAIELNRDVLEKRVTVHKLTKTSAKKFAEANLPGTRVTRSGLIVVPKDEGTKVYSRSGKLYRKRLSPKRTMVQKTEILPVSPKPTSLRAYIDNLRTDPDLQSQLEDGKMWAFKFFGNNSYKSYADLDLLARSFERYQSVEAAMEKNEGEREIIEAFEIYQRYPNEDVIFGGGFKRYPTGRKRKPRTAAQRKAYREQMKIRNPEGYERLLAKEAERARRKYERDQKDTEKAADRRRRQREKYWQKKDAWNWKDKAK